MAKYIELAASGDLREALPVVVSAGAGDAERIVQTDASGKLDQSLLPVGMGADTQVIVASEGLAAGDFVNIWADAGTAKVRKADAATAGKEADGFVLAVVASGANATVYFEDDNTQLASLAPGTKYFLSATTPGGVTDTPPNGTGKVVQRLGKALSATALKYERGRPITLA
ncbi:MAG: hypothetical protein MSG64_07490 [Pyrinomonadaceae bacterium MAG19_C2-C3]|nr:hypothetical protein [Pyrinomonadaceae bacterium MAG19_C2-C3]